MGSGWDQKYDVDAWNADVLDVPLPRTLIELRDGIAANDPANAAAARARRLEQVKEDIAKEQAFIDDCDRHADDLKTTSCLTPLIPTLMRQYLAQLRAYAVSSKATLEAERDAKKSA